MGLLLPEDTGAVVVAAGAAAPGVESTEGAAKMMPLDDWAAPRAWRGRVEWVRVFVGRRRMSSRESGVASSARWLCVGS